VVATRHQSKIICESFAHFFFAYLHFLALASMLAYFLELVTFERPVGISQVVATQAVALA